MKKDNIIQHILDKYLGLKKTKDNKYPQEDMWEAGINDYKKNQEDFELSKKLDKAFSLIRQNEKNKTEENHLQELLNKIDYTESVNVFTEKRQSFGKALLKVAAVLVPIAIITSLTVFYFSANNETSAYQVISTQKGSKTKIALEDGTLIWLNAESEIKYPSTFKNKDKRIVELKGEAFFDVARNEKKPFEVYASGYKINVLGTSFNVKAYPTQETIETTLETGKIDIEEIIPEDSNKKPRKITLVPNQTIVLFNEQRIAQNDEQSQTVPPKVSERVDVKQKGKIIESDDLSEYTSWKENELVFKSKSLEEIIPDLERWFNIDISVEDDSLNQIICTGNFHNETAEQVIQALCIASKIDYKIDKNKVVLKANKNTTN